MDAPRLLITGYSDPHLWYAGMVGQQVPCLGQWPEGWKSREPAGYVNVVRYSDARLVDAAQPAAPAGAAQPRTITLRDAERYVGMPYVVGEFDCMDLAVLVQRELFGREISLPVDRRRPGGVRSQAAEIHRWRDVLAVQTSLAETGCAVLLTEPGELVPTWHIGTVFMPGGPLGEVWVLHASAAIGSAALHRLGDLQRWGMRKEGFWLWK